ncbi:MAG TPA: lysophospholipid acyltransferase family protein [Chloroflexia bacterium]
MAVPSLTLLLNVPLLPFRKKAGDLPFHPANKNVVGNWVLTRLLVLPALRRAFGGIYLYLQHEARRLRSEPDVPVIYCSTHPGWWDGYLSYVVNERTLRREGYLMMEEVHLAGVPFATWAGVFGIDRHDPRKALASIEYIVDILRHCPNTALYMFPQGTITHPDSRPLGLYGGVGNLARRLDRCAVLPVAVRYEFLLEQAPEVFVRIGAPVRFDMRRERLASAEVNARIEGAMTATADTLHADIVAGDLQAYRPVLRGRVSVNRRWERVVGLAGRVRSLLRRP